MNETLAELVEVIRRETGIALSLTQESTLRAAVNRAAPGVEPAAFLRGMADPARRRHLVDRLIDEVTIKETSFVRDRRQLDAIPWQDLLQRPPEAGSATIRVWSAGSATGEEAYSLALLADEDFAPENAPVDVLGTDVSLGALAAASVGRYRERAVRDLDQGQRRRYLDQQADGTYLVRQRLRSLVRFRRHNLASDPIPPLGEAGFDLIVCRNVFIYFDAPLIERVIEGFEGSLRPGGMLLIGAADALRSPSAPPARRPPAAPPRGAGPAAMRRTSGPSGARPTRHVPRGPLRGPLQRPTSREQRLTAALEAADKASRDDALAHAASLLADYPLDADARFLHGLLSLDAGEPAHAAASLRRALFIDPAFALAAFTLGRAYDALGNAPAARRAYQQALRTLDPDDARHELILQQVDVDDIAAACHARLGGQS